MASFMDIVIKEVLVKFGIKHQTLVGAHSARERIQIVNQFNNDTSVSVLILTTSVGGLGLTLTGADVVIFVEHDWNPMKDLQAMDRAHRIGATRTVNVYRLILRDTLEEKIMSLQRFKENLARSLIQARGDDVTTGDPANLELTGLLKSFEEHSNYRQAAGTAADPKAPQAASKQAAGKGAKMMKQLISGGLPDDAGLAEVDPQAAEIERLWQGIQDFEQV